MNRTLLVLVLAIPIVAFLLDRQGLLTPAKNMASAVVTPMTRGVTGVVRSTFETVRAFGSVVSLEKENRSLREENQRLLSELAEKTEVMHENDLLRFELNLPVRAVTKEGLAAFVVARSNIGAFGTLFVDRGSADGVKEGWVVLSQGTLVGRVGEVWEHTSVVIPITNVNSVIPATLVESRGLGLLRGGVQGLTVSEISRDVQVKVGEAVVTSLLGDLVRPGMLIGTVESIGSNPSDVFQTVTVTSPIPFNWLEFVIILP